MLSQSLNLANNELSVALVNFRGQWARFFGWPAACLLVRAESELKASLERAREKKTSQKTGLSGAEKTEKHRKA